MSARVAILTPDPADEGYRTRWREVLETEAAPLRKAGMHVEGRGWAEATDLAEFDLVLPLLVWGYQRARGQWLEAVARWESESVRLHNPGSVLRWNADKTYLGRLAARGAPIIPTLYADRLTEAVMYDAVARFGTERLVAKPQVSASAWQTIRWAPGETLDGGPEGPAMVQPYLADIESMGETSLMWFGGVFSHAISKIPRAGDFRVQPEYDAKIAGCTAEPDQIDAARHILAAVDEDLLYARVDLVRGPGGAPTLIELELIEPDLYLECSPGAEDAFAAAVTAAARREVTRQ